MQKLYVGDKGKGFPLVLIHGFLGSSTLWKLQIGFFKKSFRVITPDLPGFGKSFKAQPHRSIKKTAKIILEVLKKKKIDKFHLLGHSMGGMIAQEMTKISSDKISKVIFYSTGAIGEMPGRFESVDQSRKNLKVNGLKSMIKQIVKTWFIRKEKSRYYNTCIHASTKASVKTVDNYLKTLKKWNGVSTLKKIKNETLIVWGNKDKSYNLNQIKTLKKNIKNSKLVIFKGCAHNVHLEKSKKFNSVIKSFLI
tara:strand:+ start:76 stop:828 length:753 start_codon:yes stop_codon:yes gene_type:complete